MSTSDLAAAVDAMSSRIMALETLLFALADACPDRESLREAFELYAASVEAKMIARPVADRQLEQLRASLADMRAAIR
jgi:hypothetical protein